MSRFGRHILFSSVIALHAIVSLCGQCLHELPGSPHKLGAASKANCPGDSVPSPRQAPDDCVICHFIAQGQLPVECSAQISDVAIAELPAPELPASRPVHTHVPSSPRAPPQSLQS